MGGIEEEEDGTLRLRLLLAAILFCNAAAAAGGRTEWTVQLCMAWRTARTAATDWEANNVVIYDQSPSLARSLASGFSNA